MSPPTLTVAILTFRRPWQLKANLDAVVQRVLEVGTLATTRILVVDNDPTGSAHEVVADQRVLPVDYVIEPRAGISAARNRALDESKDHQLLAFIDDDEVPQEGWLSSLIVTWLSTGADAVMGRLVSVLPENVDPWVREGGFFARPTYATGTRLEAAATFNLLLDLTTVRCLKLRFDENLGLSGGEDTIFTRELTRADGIIVACKESVAHDLILGERLTRRWVLKRAFSQGSVLINTRLRLARSARERTTVRLVGVIGGLARTALGVTTATYGVIAPNVARRAGGSRVALRGIGVLVGSVGYRHRTYRRVKGTV